MTRPAITQLVTFLRTDNLAATTQFYEQILGLPLALDQGACRIYQASPTAFIGFCQQGTAVGTDCGTIITLVSPFVDEWYDYLRQQQIPIEKPPTHNEQFNIYHLFLRDPNQYLVEIQTFLDPQWPHP